MEFIERTLQATTPEDVVSAMHAQVANLDVAYLSHRTIFDPSKTISRSTMPREWLDHYEGSDYYRIDPGLQRVKTATGPISMSFDETHPTFYAQGRARTMFAEMTSFQATGSYFVPFRETPCKPAASVNFLTDCPGSQFDKWLEAHSAKMHLHAVVAHTRIFEILRPSCSDEKANPLAPREREVLQWLAQGLQTSRIAERMEISDRTVEFHLKNARAKLNASTREHALAKALTKGFIEI